MGGVAELRVDFVEIGIQAVVAGSKLEGLRVEPRRCLSIAFDAPGVNAQVAIEHGVVEALAQRLKPQPGRVLVAAAGKEEVAKVILRAGVDRALGNGLRQDERVRKALREHLMVRGCCGLGRETLRSRSVLPGPRVRGEVVVDERRQRTGGQVLQRPLENGVSRRIIT